MRVSDYPLRVAVLTGCGSGVGARLLADCTWSETAWRAGIGLAAGWVLARGALLMLHRAQQAAQSAMAQVDLAENPLTDAMVAKAQEQAMGPQAVEHAAQIVSRMMHEPAKDDK